ncbi:MAG: cation diffusion facilitator family transporter [Spirochaetota bacterium]
MEVDSQEKELRNMRTAVIIYSSVFVLKLAVYFVSGVMVVLADALHSLSDVIIYIFLWIAAIWSRKGADEVHMFGHGRAQNVAALVAGTIFITFTSYKLFEESIPKLINPRMEAVHNLYWALGVIIFTMVLLAVPLIKLWRQKSRGAAARAQALEIINDQLSSVAAVAGIVFLMNGIAIVDPIATATVAALIAFNGFRLFRENLSILVGSSPGKAFLEKVQEEALSVPGVKGVHNLRAEYVGPDTVHTGMHIEVASGITIEEANTIAQKVKEHIHRSISMTGHYCYIHVDPEK